eukprot:TRINITY_DN19351_c0_g1_i1.p1 TRINITY_DN19351_c0_g1~~TRINITY_DN19351_c0_g1_i1.p1  ORF type:complete len:504 (-),score=77.47 TRINITY_DN19351_c0_g1_i1:273-1784(-)
MVTATRQQERGEDADPYELDRVANWIVRGNYRRVAVQFPDELFADAPATLKGLRSRLPPSIKLFILGDCTYGSSNVDEVGAEHYAADSIVHIGPADGQHNGRLPVLFIFGRAPVTADALGEKAKADLKLLPAHSNVAKPTSLLLVCDVALQHAAGKLCRALLAALGQPQATNGARHTSGVFLTEPPCESESKSCGRSSKARLSVRRVDFRYGSLTLEDRWATSLGALAVAAAAQPEPLRICGREVRCWDAETETASPGPRILPAECGIVLCTSAADSMLERRLILRHSQVRPIYRMDPDTGALLSVSSQKLLLSRYRYVELAKAAGVVGLVMTATGSRYTPQIADRLEDLLRRAGRSTYRFMVGQVTPEKLGMFSEVELFVSLASPEHFPWDCREFVVPIASPYEVEVALGAREWTGEYIIDPEEMLWSPTTESALGEEDHVQTLGPGAKVRKFEAGGQARDSRLDASNIATAPAALQGDFPPAQITSGLDGVAARYGDEAER